MKRISVYINEEEHKKIKSELASKGLTISEWIRKQIKKLLNSLSN